MNTFLLYYPFLFALLSFIFLLAKQLRSRKPTPNLPPGSMGWPYLGETLQLYSQNPNVFFATRQSRYGEVFKTHILGRVLNQYAALTNEFFNIYGCLLCVMAVHI
ncbi:unnamed protein product [Prunus brigantina]